MNKCFIFISMLFFISNIQTRKNRLRVLEEIDTENPDLETLDQLEADQENEGIFEKLVQEKKEVLERMEILDDLVNNELKKTDDDPNRNINK